ncbi:MAG: glycerol-3-phosphate 1-O-acyltransferase PlsY [Clostridia bacterium]
MGTFVLWGILVAVVAYFLGSVNFSIILTRLYKQDDIRNYGSGNAGMTNVLRVVGKKAALYTFIFDFLKCVVSVLIGLFVFTTLCKNLDVNMEYANFGKYIAGFACMMGHNFPVYFNFRGGKGVVTACALIAVVDWRVFIFVIATFGISFLIKKTISLSSILAAAMYPIATFFVTYFLDYRVSVELDYLIAVTAISLLIGLTVIIKHKDNIKRILNGTEKPIISKKA